MSLREDAAKTWYFADRAVTLLERALARSSEGLHGKALGALGAARGNLHLAEAEMKDARR